MYRYKRILVNLNLDGGDANLIKHASTISHLANSEKLYFLYTEKKFDLPKEVIKAYPQLNESAADFAREKITELIDQNYNNENKSEIITLVEEGQSLDAVLKQVRINGIDLVLTSVDADQSESRDFAPKLARKAPCSVLVIPKNSEFSLINPAVAIDFSEHSRDAFDAALAFVKASGIEKINMLHVYQVPTGYHKTGKSYDEFSEIMQGHAANNFSEFKSDFNLKNIQILEQYLLNTKPQDAIKNAVEKNKITFLALGARGRGAGAAVMLGSVSEKLIETLNIPVLAVKKKGSGMNILNALFK